MKKATIYTGTGDTGTTSLIGGTRVPKDHARVEAYGTIDELNAQLGLLVAALSNKESIAFIEHTESDLLSIGSYLATEDNAACPIHCDAIKRIESAIDHLEATLTPMHRFILPASNEAAARANLCRTVCRRAERAIVTLDRESTVAPSVLIYVNRLSDYLFLLQRQLLDGEEKIWEKHCK